MTEKRYPYVTEVILSAVLRGDGVGQSPCREVIQVSRLDGTFIAEFDPVTDMENNTVKVGEYTPHLEQNRRKRETK